MVVAVLKRFNIYLLQLTLNAIVKLGFFGLFKAKVLNPMPKLFCQTHELHFQRKTTRGLHNNFGSYNFAYRKGAMFPALAY
jgi:hypothetical protein